MLNIDIEAHLVTSFESYTDLQKTKEHCQKLISDDPMKALKAVQGSAKNKRLDFIFLNMSHDIVDSFFCEDKSTAKESIKDRKKGDFVRQKSLQYWATLLPFASNIKHLTSISCQFNRLLLQVKATKIINGITVHVLLKEVRIPDTHDGQSLSQYITTIISLVRMVTENFEKFKCINNVEKDDDLIFYNSTCINSFEEDSPSSSQSSSQDEDEEFHDIEREMRVKRNIEPSLAAYQEETDTKYFNCT